MRSKRPEAMLARGQEKQPEDAIAEKGMDVRSPAGKRRTLKHPWSVLAYQVAGDDGLKILHADNKAEARFQKARGVLRIFALALREAESWDSAPVVGPGVLLNAPGREGLSEALRELVTVADTEDVVEQINDLLGQLNDALRLA